MRKTFKEYYKAIGLNDFPFDTFTTEQEIEVSKNLFVSQGEYDPIVDAFKAGRNIILLGERGSGKTAILEDFNRFLKNSKKIITSIHDFSELDKCPKNTDIYKLLITSFLTDLFSKLGENPLKLWNLNREEKILLSYLLAEFLPPVTQNLLKDKISQIQVPFYSRCAKWAYNKVRGPLNFGATVGKNFAYQYLIKHFSFLPPLTDEDKIQDFFPELNSDIDSDFLNQSASFALLKRIGNISDKLGFKKPVILLDRLDEDQRFENDAEVISDFISPFLTDSNLLSMNEFQIVFFIWSTPFRFIQDLVRTQKYFCPSLKWSREDLEKLLNRRLEYYSTSRITNYRKLFCENIEETDLDKIFDLANSNPRDLLHIFKILFKEQYSKNPEITKFDKILLNEALTKYVLNFNYYEYYPRKSNARANTMDIYSYSAHLLKLDSEEFSKNQLNEKAGTGGSTNNYVVSMEKIGLIENIRSDKGNAVYRIKDPKIIFCLNHNLELKK